MDAGEETREGDESGIGENVESDDESDNSSIDESDNSSIAFTVPCTLYVLYIPIVIRYIYHSIMR